MDKQEFGQSEELLHLREMPLPEPIEVHFALREADLVEGLRAALRLKHFNLIGAMFLLAGVLFLMVGAVFPGMFAILFALFGWMSLGQAAKKAFRKEPLLQQPLTWTFADTEATLDHPRSASRMDWSVYKRVVETTNLFMLFPQENLYNPIPKRAFADAEEMERFRELVREKGIEIKVVGRG